MKTQLAVLNNQERRTKTYKEIFRKPDSPIYLQQLVVWMATSSRNIEYVLGDFIEGYEHKAQKYGVEAAKAWATKQATREATSRIKNVLGIISGMRWIMHWIFGHTI